MTKNSIRPCKASDAAYVSGLINRPWARDGLHCWQLVVDVQRDLFDRALPALLETVPLGGEGMRQRARLFAGDERAHWREIVVAEHGAIALMHRVGTSTDLLIHAGVYLSCDGGGVVHCDDPQGVAFDALRELTLLRRWSPRFFIPRD